MKPFPRLLRYVRPYWSPLILSVILMAIAGAGHAMMPLLIGPVFDRVLDPRSPDTPLKLFTNPLTREPVFLQQFVPAAIHNVWTMVALAIIFVMLVKGLADYFGNY